MPDQPGEIVRWRTVSWDVIDLPTDKIKDGLPFDKPARDLPSLPNREFHLYFRYNENDERWRWWVELDGEGEIISVQPVGYGKSYTFGEYIGFAFIDFAREDREVTRETLGDEVELITWPGYESPGWDDWIARQEILERELPQVGAL